MLKSVQCIDIVFQTEVEQNFKKLIYLKLTFLLF